MNAIGAYASPQLWAGFIGFVLVMLQQRSMAQMIERQLTHRAAAQHVAR